MKTPTQQYSPQTITANGAASNGSAPPGTPQLGAEEPRWRPVSEEDAALACSIGDRHWQIWGLDRNTRSDALRVVLRVSREGPDPDAFHTDLVNLYRARSRRLYIRHAARALGLAPEIVERDLRPLQRHLEALHRQTRGQSSPPVEGEASAGVVTPANAEPPASERSQAERAEAEAFLLDPHLQSHVEADLALSGFAGAEAVAAYLAATSRLSEEPSAVTIPADSPTGDRSLLDLVGRFMPDESVVNYDLLTPEALARIEERALKHKILTVAEPAKASSRLRRTLVRLHTQRQLTAYASERDPDTGERTTQPHPVRGPTALFLLTPDIDPDDELARHSLVLGGEAGGDPAPLGRHPDGGRQTEAELRRRARAKARQAIHRNAQRLLEPLTVLHPDDASEPAFPGPPSRRAFQRVQYWKWVSASALLNQRRRVRKTVVEGSETFDCIVSDAEDQALANRLAEQLFDRSADLPPRTAQLLEQLCQMVRQLAAGQRGQPSPVHFSCAQAREWIGGWAPTQFYEHLRRLRQLGCAIVREGGPGKRLIYELDAARCAAALAGGSPDSPPSPEIPVVEPTAPESDTAEPDEEAAAPASIEPDPDPEAGAGAAASDAGSAADLPPTLRTASGNLSGSSRDGPKGSNRAEYLEKSGNGAARLHNGPNGAGEREGPVPPAGSAAPPPQQQVGGAAPQVQAIPTAPASAPNGSAPAPPPELAATGSAASSPQTPAPTPTDLSGPEPAPAKAVGMGSLSGPKRSATGHSASEAANSSNYGRFPHSGTTGRPNGAEASTGGSAPASVPTPPPKAPASGTATPAPVAPAGPTAVAPNGSAPAPPPTARSRAAPNAAGGAAARSYPDPLGPAGAPRRGAPASGKSSYEEDHRDD